MSSSDKFLDSSDLIEEGSAHCLGLPDISPTSLPPQGTTVVGEKSTCMNTKHDTVKIVNPRLVVIQPKDVIQPEVAIQPQVVIQPQAGPSLGSANSQQARRLPSTSNWESPGRDTNVRTSKRCKVIVQQTEPVLTEQFENIPSISSSPLHKGKQRSGVPNLLPDGSSIRTAKSAQYPDGSSIRTAHSKL